MVRPMPGKSESLSPDSHWKHPHACGLECCTLCVCCCKLLAIQTCDDYPSPHRCHQRDCIHHPCPARHRRSYGISTLLAFEVSPRARDPAVVIPPLEFVASAAPAPLDDLRRHRWGQLHHNCAHLKKTKSDAFATWTMVRAAHLRARGL